MLIFRENPEKFLCSLSPEMSLLSEFQNFNRQHRLFEKKSKILLAVSGGMDSVAMVELFHQAEISFGIAHCNFNLRGKESEDDQAFVRALSKKYKVPFFTKKFNTKKIANQGQLSIQEAARNLRYNWFEEIRKEKSFDKIATAHQLDDSIETFFINLLRGTGIKGLIGIPTKTGKIIRPLNFCSRAQIFAFVKANEIDWREDSSSSTGKIFDAGNHRILVNRGKLLLEKKKEIPEESLIVTREMKCVQFHKQSISLIMNNIDKEAPFSKKNEIQVLDADKIEFPLVLRPWKSGDFFYPLGMKHRKKLSDYFTDKKISRFDKEKFLVCLSAGNIVCILGLGIDERFKVRNSTKKVLQVRSTFD
ncbi:MAG: tRNA lysidine(34) synthetase TilS [Bacteroidetes bacterium]|nr:tRNA lysidine(34) synthetase TilS [Bacteroidota bacterium]